MTTADSLDRPYRIDRSITRIRGGRQTQVSAPSDSAGAKPLDRSLLLFCAVVVLLVYGFELFNFTLSIDEELHAYEIVNWKAWATQGRWGMATLTFLVPELSALPLIPTLVFCLGLAGSAFLLAPCFSSSRLSAYTFCGLFIGSPIWLHIGQFNTLSWGVGIAMLLVALAARMIETQRVSAAIGAGALVAMAVSIYQSSILLYILVGMLLCFRSNAFYTNTREPTSTNQSLRRCGWLVCSIIVSMSLYLAVQWLFLRLIDVQISYIDGFVCLSEFFGDRRNAALERTTQRLGGFLMGTDPTFLRYGAPILILSWLGVLTGFCSTVRCGRKAIMKNAGGFLLVTLAILIATIFIPMSAGRIPTRALMALPVCYAILGTNALADHGRCGALKAGLLCVSVFLSAVVGTQLFYSDYIARKRDQVLAQQIVDEIQAIRPIQNAPRTNFVVVGRKEFDARGPVRNVEIFGQSFFGFNGGNPWRICAYLRLLGVQGLIAKPIVAIKKDMHLVDKMPAWPAKGSIALIDDHLVVKFGTLSHSQSLALARE